LVVFKKGHPQHDFNCLEKIGEGAYGRVFKVSRKSDKQLAALKTIIAGRQISHDDIVNEIGLMKMCAEDEGVLDVYETYLQDGKYFIVVEIMDYPLNSVIEVFEGKLDERVCKYIIFKAL
jgi:serine/threonine protein kinase